jgi:hypothetical protein
VAQPYAQKILALQTAEGAADLAKELATFLEVVMADILW